MTMQGWGVKTFAGLGMFAGWFLACAGDDIPPIEDDLRGALEQEFGGAPTATAGSGGSGTAGRGGSGSSGSGSGNAGSANAGSANSGGGAAGAGGGGEPVGGSGGGVDAPDCDAFPILQESCGLAGCHGANAPYGNFGESEDAISDFLDKPSVDSDCDSLIVDTANPADSLLYTKLNEDWPRECGTLQMPAAGDFLSEDDALCVLGWLGRFAK